MRMDPSVTRLSKVLRRTCGEFCPQGGDFTPSMNRTSRASLDEFEEYAIMASNSVPNLANQPDPQPNEENRASPPQPASFGHKRFFWPILCLFQFGLLIGIGIVWMRSGKPVEPPREPAEGVTQRPPPVPPKPAEAPPALPQPGDLARADELLRGTWYDAA